MTDLWALFLLFLKVNLLTTSGPASVGLLHEETVGRFLAEDEFVKAVAFSNVLPGSDALQLAMYVGYQVGGLPGALVALLASILPPAVLAVLLAVTAYKLLGETGWRNVGQLLIGAGALAALVFFRVPAWIVLIAAGVGGLLFLR